ncbi:hypothetical protein ACPUEK_03840 [Marinomonas gallaica]|uniref:hypothetical protein n=1 Tax=Marinomonas gallaica TaxID=1806667 RepID=UPI003CE474E5
MATISLRKRFSRKVLIPFILGALVLCSAVWVMDYYTQRGHSLASLHQRTQTLSMSFSAYLDRANFEVKYLSEQVNDGETIDGLFQLHDVLFFGGLDFFYVVLENGQVMEDPRVRLYTQDTPDSLIQGAQINAWRHVSSSDRGEMLVFKKSLGSNSVGQSQGFFYGFISLNNNLALASDLITSADADFIRIKDLVGNVLLVEKQRSFSDDIPYITHDSILSIPELEDNLTVELRFARPLTESFSGVVMIGCAVVLICFLLMYWLIQFYAQRVMFVPITGLPALGREGAMDFLEFQPLLAQMNRFQVQLKVREQHLELLSNSLQSAILFCDESSRVTNMNKEAKGLFPSYQFASTVFDMTPIACHQPIQRALKGEYGGGFELEFPESDRVYDFNTYSFINEHGFRSVMLVGRDVSEIRRLRWHLTHRFPQHTLDRPHPPSQLILQELASCKDHLETSPQSTVRWLNVIGDLLTKISHLDSAASKKMPLGELVVQVQDELDLSLVPSSKQQDFSVELSLSDAQLVAEWTQDHRSMLMVAFLLCINSSISGRYIHIGWEKNSLVIKLFGLEEMTPALQWLSHEYPKLVKGRVDASDASRFVMMATLMPEAQHDRSLNVIGKHAVLVKNDYTESNRLLELLKSIGMRVEVYSSFAEFFGAGTPYRTKYDVMFVGVGDIELAKSGVDKLLTSSRSQALPVIHVGNHRSDELPGETMLAHQLMPFRLASMVVALGAASKISLGDWATHATNFIITGGTHISQVIWQSELNASGFVARREVDIINLMSVLRHHSPVVVVVLDKATAQLAMKYHLEHLGNTKWIVLEDFLDRPDTMRFIDVEGRLPNDGALEALLQNLNVKGE